MIAHATPSILALDPGSEQTAWVQLDPLVGIPIAFGIDPNEAVTHRLAGSSCDLAIEMIASYGMPVGAEVFATCVWIGRFIQASPQPAMLLFRREVKDHLCHSPKANDATVRQALIDRFGPGREKAIGVKSARGPLYGVSNDVWAALAVAVTIFDRRASQPSRLGAAP